MNRLFLAAVLLSTLCLPVLAVTVDGFCYLEGATDHSGIKVKFVKVSITAVTDSTYTDAVGHFAKEIAPGIYTVQYSMMGWTAAEVANQSGAVSCTLAPVTLLDLASVLSGTVTGSVGPGEFRVIGDISVPRGSTLSLQPGTRLLFTGRYRLNVTGTLEALGTAADSIVFTRLYPVDSCRWGAIKILNEWETTNRSTATLRYCKLEYSAGTFNEVGGAIEVRNGGVLMLEHSTLTDNRADGMGGAVYDFYSQVHIDACVFARNSAGSGGRAVHCTTASGAACPTIENTTFSDNSPLDVYLTAGGIVRNCHVLRTGPRSGTGLILYEGDYEITDTRLENLNTGISNSHGTTELPYPHSVYQNVVFAGCNSGLSLSYVSATVTGCVFARCAVRAVEGGGDGGVSFTACTFEGNATCGWLEPGYQFTGCVFANSTDHAFVSYSGGTASVQYCDFYNNAPADFTNTQWAPPAIGQRLLTNANGDSCDIYMNVFEDPMFADTAAGDYHLLAGSPCIDAGDPALPPDPDGTIADIGAFPFHHGLVVTPRILAFGDVAVGDSSDQTITLTNGSDSPVSVREMTSSLPAFQVFFNLADSVLMPDASRMVTVRFIPDSCREYTAAVTINAGSGNQTVTLKSTGRGAFITLAPAALDFGTIEPGYPVLRSLALQNRGNQTLFIENWMDNPPFTILCAPDSLPAGGSDSLVVQFAPLANGLFSDELVVITNAYNRDSLCIPVYGAAELIPAAVQNVVVQIDGNDADLYWSPVTTSIHAHPIVTDAYLVNYCESVGGPFFFHGLTVDTTYTHEHVVQFSRGMYYQVTAYIGSVSRLQQILAGLGESPRQEAVRQAIGAAY